MKVLIWILVAVPLMIVRPLHWMIMMLVNTSQRSVLIILSLKAAMLLVCNCPKEQAQGLIVGYQAEVAKAVKWASPDTKVVAG